MELKRCSKGHSFDPSITPECPECAAQAGHTVPLVGVDMSGGRFLTCGLCQPIGRHTLFV